MHRRRMVKSWYREQNHHSRCTENRSTGGGGEKFSGHVSKGFHGLCKCVARFKRRPRVAAVRSTHPRQSCRAGRAGTRLCANCRSRSSCNTKTHNIYTYSTHKVPHKMVTVATWPLLLFNSLALCWLEYEAMFVCVYKHRLLYYKNSYL